MFKFRVTAFILIMLAVVGAASAQTPSASPTPDSPEKLKEKQEKVLPVLEVMLADVSMLRLPGNRALAYGLIGELYWDIDKERARDLFRRVEAEIVADQAENEDDRGGDPNFVVYDFNDARAQILPVIARYDADLALEMLIRTRSPQIVAAIARSQQNEAGAGMTANFDPQAQRAGLEVRLEQMFAASAAAQDPEKAVKLLKDSLKKGISFSLMSALNNIYQKDPKKAEELSADVVAAITSADLSKRFEDLNAVLNIISTSVSTSTSTSTSTAASGNAAPSNRSFRFSDAQYKEIANKLADTILASPGTMQQASILQRAMASFERIIPTRVPQLKGKLAEIEKALPAEAKRLREQERSWNANLSPEEILADILKTRDEFARHNLYSRLGSKIIALEDEARAKRLIEQIPDTATRDRIRDQYAAAQIDRTAAGGKLDDARSQIAAIAKTSTRIQRLISLARSYEARKTDESHKTAMELMAEARSLVNQFPEDESELADLMTVISGYATVEPETAFKLFDPIITQVNEVMQASAILSKYNRRDRSFRKGELVMSVSGGSNVNLLTRYAGNIQELGRVDLDRASLAAERLQRGDSKLLARIYLIRGYLKNSPPPAMRQADSPTYVFSSF